MNLFGGARFIQLTDDNEKPTAHGRIIILARDHIVAVYRREDDPKKSNVFTSDGCTYIVQEDVQTIFNLIS